MKKVLFFIFIVSVFVLPAYAQDILPVSEIIKKVDKEKNTSSDIKEYYKGIKGKQAEGTGKVVDVIEGRRDKHKVTVLCSEKAPEKGHDVVLYTTMNAPAELKVGDMIKFKGELGRLSTYKSSSIDIHGTYEKIK